jgi:hypothetical protein
MDCLSFNKDYAKTKELKEDTEFNKITADGGFLVLQEITKALLNDPTVYERILLICKCYTNIKMHSQYMELRSGVRELLKKQYKSFDKLANETTTARFIVTILIEKIIKREFDISYKNNLDFIYQGWCFNDIKHYQRHLLEKNRKQTESQPSTGETIMACSTKPIQTITYFYGQEVDRLTDEQAINMLDTLATAIENAKRNKSGSKKQEAKIKQMEADLEAMRKIVDERPEQ